MVAETPKKKEAPAMPISSDVEHGPLSCGPVPTLASA
jgi:hypothetical protein